MKIYIPLVLYVVSLWNNSVAVGPDDPINLDFNLHPNDEDTVGRIKTLDQLIFDNIEKISSEENDLKDIIKQAEKLVAKSDDKSTAQYYVDLLTLIQDEGTMAVLHDERERLIVIMQSVGKGAEFDHTLKQRNIIGAFSEAEANLLFKQLPDIGMRDFTNFDIPEFTSTKTKKPHVRPDEPSGESLETLRRAGRKEEETEGESQPEIPEGAQDKTLTQDTPVEGDKQPEIPDGVLNGGSVSSTNEQKEKDQPETPVGDGGVENTDKNNDEDDPSKRPKIPVGTHDEI